MNVEEFTKKLEAEFDDLEPGSIQPDTDYRTIKGWSSMHALIIIAFIDINYDITLNGAELKNTTTIRDLYNYVQQKKSA
jgi:acyl carrier protein